MTAIADLEKMMARTSQAEQRQIVDWATKAIVRRWRRSRKWRILCAWIVGVVGVALGLAMFVVPNLSGWQRLPYSFTAGVLIGLAYQLMPNRGNASASPRRRVYIFAFALSGAAAATVGILAALVAPGWWAAGLSVATAALAVGLAERYPGKYIPFAFLLPVALDAWMLLQLSTSGDRTQLVVVLTLFVPAFAVAIVLTVWAFKLRNLPSAEYAKATEVARGVLWAWILLLAATLAWSASGLKLGSGEQFDPLVFAIPLVTFGSVIATATTGWTRYREARLQLDADDQPAAEAKLTSSEQDGQPAIPSHVRGLVEGLMRLRSNFLRNFARPREDPDGEPARHSLPTPLASAGDLVALMLRAGVGARYEGRFDKIDWVYRLRYRGEECRLQLGRSGLWADFWIGEDEGARLADQLGKQLTKALRFLHQNGLRDAIDAGISVNAVEVVNQFFRYRGMVNYFIAQLRGLRGAPMPEVDRSTFTVHDFESGKQVPAPDFIADTMSYFSEFQNEQQRAGEIAHVATALVASYFAYIEHVSVLLAAYSSAASEDGFAVSELLRESWAVKFDVAFADVSIGSAKSDLSLMASRFRNPLLHGGAGRAADGLYVEVLPDVVALATEDGSPTDQFMLWKPSLTAEEIDWILSRIARIDAALESHPYWVAVSAGAPSNFSRDRVRKALSAQRSGNAGQLARAMAEALDD